MFEVILNTFIYFIKELYLFFKIENRKIEHSFVDLMLRSLSCISKENLQPKSRRLDIVNEIISSE